MKVEKARTKRRFEDPAQMIEVGNEYMYMKKYQKAAEIFEMILDDHPGLTHRAKAYNDCGIAYAALGNYEKAIENFEEAINLERYLLDSGAKAYRNLGHVYELMGDDARAKENFEKAAMLEAEFYHYWVTNCDEFE